MIKTAKKKQTIVFAVNMDSPSSVQVKTGKRTSPVDEPMNLAVHTEPVASAVIRQAYQKSSDVGTPSMRAEASGLSFHQSDKN
tara:strand:- start:1074 stop:1322 length:249 start_codon:yes stop_codon:yes gene_type:complete